MIAEIISTYPPLQNTTRIGKSARTQNFYSHAPCEARPACCDRPVHPCDFYSHAPCGARPGQNSWKCRLDHFYSHASCEARHISICDIFIEIVISTHTPLARRDFTVPLSTVPAHLFLLTHPMRGATGQGVYMIQTALNFYSHAPCGARHQPQGKDGHQVYFYSHAPCGARQHDELVAQAEFEFLLTRPMRGATTSHQ